MCLNVRAKTSRTAQQLFLTVLFVMFSGLGSASSRAAAECLNLHFDSGRSGIRKAAIRDIARGARPESIAWIDVFTPQLSKLHKGIVQAFILDVGSNRPRSCSTRHQPLKPTIVINCRSPIEGTQLELQISFDPAYGSDLAATFPVLANDAVKKITCKPAKRPSLFLSE